MKESVNQIATYLRNLAKKQKQFSQVLREVNKLNIKHKLINNIKPCVLTNLKICGVDGGFLKKEYHGFGLLLRRAVATLFTYKNGILSEVSYYPKPRPVPEPIVTGPEIPEHDFSTFASLKRCEVELLTAISAAKEFRPDLLVLDGSIVIHPSTVPNKTSPVYITYKEVISLYQKLYELCEQNSILLVGAIEDSRGKRYCNILKEQIIPNLLNLTISSELKKTLDSSKFVLDNCTDTVLLYYILSKGERTQHFNYAKTEDLPILRDLGDKWTNAVYAMYIKAVEFDRPLRLDFLATKNECEVANKIASLIWMISKQNRSYAYPSVLIEADARAKLTEQEISLFKSAINEQIGHNPSLFELRRELRPF